MAHGHIKVLDSRANSAGFKGVNCTPKVGVMPDCVACDITLPSFELTVEFDREEIATMVGALGNYMPTLDQAQRFMRSNPAVTFEMMAEIRGIGDEEKAELSGGRLREAAAINPNGEAK